MVLVTWLGGVVGGGGFSNPRMGDLSQNAPLRFVSRVYERVLVSVCDLVPLPAWCMARL